MIEFTKSYKTADGEVFATIEEAQIHEFESLIGSLPDNITALTHLLVSEKDKIVDILTTTSNSKPKGRRINGGTKKRHKTVITDAATNSLQMDVNVAQ